MRSRPSGSLVAVLVAVGCTVESAPLAPVDVETQLETLRGRVEALEAAAECPLLSVMIAGGSGVPEVRAYGRVAGEEGVVCRQPTSGDVMVKVGDFWIDRYEMTACPGGSVGTETGNDTTAAACSQPGVTPPGSVTWFQAAAMCANAGKHLCSNAEWQAAVSGTIDPVPPNGGAGKCLTVAAAPRPTGMGSMCRSRFGAEDMVGNLWEWVADWDEGGKPALPDDGLPPEPRPGVAFGPWPPGFHDDQVWNWDGTASDGSFHRGLPAAGMRGGGFSAPDDAGSFAYSLAQAPSLSQSSLSARCCVSAP